MIQRDILSWGQPCTLACDAKCNKAWGINHRPSHQLSDDIDDYEWLSDDELGEAPADTGVYEGGHPKPRTPEERLNKWCMRECERSVVVDRGGVIALPDFSKRVRNIEPGEDDSPPQPRANSIHL